MDGWVVASAVFAAGAFALAGIAEWRRWRGRPTWYWAADRAHSRGHPGCYRIRLQLMSDTPAHHIIVEGCGLELWHGHHDHEHDRDDWPHLSTYAPADSPLTLYVEKDGTHPQPHLRISWTVPPLRVERFLVQEIPVDPEVHASQPYRMDKPRPWRRRWWQRRWAKLRSHARRRRTA